MVSVYVAKNGLGVAEEQGCMKDIDFLCGTFGKALASVGAYVVCSEVMRSFLVNRMRTFIFTTALPPLNVAWTKFILSRLGGWNDRRERLAEAALRVQAAVRGACRECPSSSHIVPFIVGESNQTILKSGRHSAERILCAAGSSAYGSRRNFPIALFR